MTPWRLRRRLREWLFDKLLGDFLSEPIETEPEPEPREETVDAVDASTPLVDDEAMSMLSLRAVPTRKEEPEPVPLIGSVEERLARYRLR